ncbi:helix-turn-helix domain-containing protein [Paraburkholderia guartelaensis]|uniref:Helix-turn-helix domain-containing protein n=1 Tax=Paraburkholderia guartelaensis TaxID=2546446 RepID=A0A4R5L0C1_9BURK|nr:helix-turn-helix domain-containing protein [Paraburkholderia guartelaensis]TDG01871.1 helix-turn-helix domain-containing protein [Paraburkholderia guartelaensis]
MKTYSVNECTPKNQKIEAWLHLLREMFVRLQYVHCDEPSDIALTASVEQRALSNLDVHLVSSTRQSLKRVPQRATDNEGEFFLFVMQVTGTGEVTQDDRRVVLTPGNFTMYDTTRPYELDFSAAFQQMVISVPRDQLCVQVPGAEKLTAYHVSGERPIGRLLRDMVHGLSAAIDEAQNGTQHLISQAVVDLIAANLRMHQPACGTMSSKLKRYQETRVKAFIKENATNSELTVSKVAEALDMSVSAIYRAFDGQHVSVAETIWLERLAAASMALRDHTLASKSIKEIAFDSGFSEAAHFSRAFRQRFGVTPREFRASGS